MTQLGMGRIKLCGCTFKRQNQDPFLGDGSRVFWSILYVQSKNGQEYLDMQYLSMGYSGIWGDIFLSRFSSLLAVLAAYITNMQILPFTIFFQLQIIRTLLAGRLFFLSIAIFFVCFDLEAKNWRRNINQRYFRQKNCWSTI